MNFDVFAQSSRRHFLGGSAMGIGGLALAWLLNEEQLLAAPEKPAFEPKTFDVTPKTPTIVPRADAMISMFMGGGPSHHDLFDPKPVMQKYDGKEFPGSDIKYDNAGGASNQVMASPFKFKKHGQSGIEISELLPHTAEIVDDITLIRSMNLGGIRNHVSGMRAMNTGRGDGATRPALGSWVTYGLGAEASNLPAFVAIPLRSIPGDPYWLSGFLPSIYQGTVVRQQEPRILNLDPPAHLRGEPQRRNLELLEQLNQFHAERHPGEHDLQARIASYELAARMQTAAKEALDISQETKATQEMYGLDNEKTRKMGEACLVARRLVERGVRFVNIWTYGWDMHQNINGVLPVRCAEYDQPSAALVKDLKMRGMLDRTLVHWGGEMGRLPVIQYRGEGTPPGRDHNTDGFSMWLAGGGLKAGYVHGATDDFGHKAVEKPVHHSDYHATLLHLFGLDPERLTYTRNNQALTLLDNQPGKVVHDIIA
jgi:hypothetical protein